MQEYKNSMIIGQKKGIIYQGLAKSVETNEKPNFR